MKEQRQNKAKMTKGKLYDDIMYGGQHKEEPKGELRIGYTAKLKNIEIVTKCRAKKNDNEMQLNSEICVQKLSRLIRNKKICLETK